MTFVRLLKPGLWIGSFLVVLFVSAGLSSGVVRAQTRWLQTVEFITPVKEAYITHALLDTLAQVIQREQVVLRRSPEDTQPVLYDDLESALFNEGLDFTSANYLFIGYRMEADQRHFNSQITHLYFIYRPEEIDGVDIPILYLDVSQKAIQRVLEQSGTSVRVNEAAIQPFIDQLSFHKLPEGTLVSLGGEVIRDPDVAAAEKARLLATIRRFVFN